MTIPIDKSLSDVREEYLDKASELQSEGSLPVSLNMNRGLIRSLLELFADGHTRLYEYLKNLMIQVFGNTATGTWLSTLHAPSVGITPITKTKATGYVTFTRESTTGNVTIQPGRIVKTKPDGYGNVFRFVTTEEVTLGEGSPSIEVLAVAEEYGSASNVAAGMITEIVTSTPGIDGVTNAADWLVTEGVDDETDESLQNRYVLAWKSVNGVTKAAYESWVKSVTGVVDVLVPDDHPRGQGTVDVVVAGTSGAPTQNLLNEVEAVIEENRPINDDVVVYGAIIQDIPIEATLYLNGGDPSEITAAAEIALSNLFDPNAGGFRIGEDVTHDKIKVAIYNVSRYIEDIHISNIASHIGIDDYHLAQLGDVDITPIMAE